MRNKQLKVKKKHMLKNLAERALGLLTGKKYWILAITKGVVDDKLNGGNNARSL